MDKRITYRVDEPIEGEWHVKMVTPSVGSDRFVQTVKKCTDKQSALDVAATLNWRMRQAYSGR
jgi:hypothetical protein